MAKDPTREPRFPLTATLAVEIHRGKKKFRFLREQDANGTIRTGRETLTRSVYSEFHVELFAADDGKETAIDVYERHKRSLVKLLRPAYEIIEMGGHNNGNHLVRPLGESDFAKYSDWLRAEDFKAGQVVVISGYGRSLKWGGSPHEADFAKL